MSIDDNDVSILEDILKNTDTSKGIALIISSPGGSGLAAERIINLCRGYSGTGEFWAIVPGKAKSAATMICLGASRIVMGPASELGPVDPQLVVIDGGHKKPLSAHNIVASYDKLFADAVACAGKLEPYLQQLMYYDPREIQWYRELIQLSKDITVRTLKSGMMKRFSEKKITERVEMFLEPKKTLSHGRPIFRDEAKKCGLKVITDVDLSGPRWSVAHELYVRTSLHVAHHAAKCVESRTASFYVPAPKKS